MKEAASYRTKWTVTRYADEDAFRAGSHYEVDEFEGNLLLNEGIGELLKLLTGDGTATAFDSSNAYLGVGESSTAAAATQTALQAATQTYGSMASGYPSISSQTVYFRSIFETDAANHDWNEFTVANGSDGTAVNLNRKVDAQGTKAAGQIWTLDLSIAFS